MARKDLATMMHIPLAAIERAGMEFVIENGAFIVRGEPIHTQVFDYSFTQDLQNEIGPREADRVLDAAGALLNTELFILKLKKLVLAH